MSARRFQVLGPVAVLAEDGGPVPIGGPRHREVLARLVVARGRVVTVDRLVDDLWPGEAPPRAAGAVQTFVSALRGALEPGRPRGRPSRWIATEGRGYAFRAAPDAVDAWCFEAELRGATTPDRLEAALARWRGPALAGVPDVPWARAERGRLAELRLSAVEALGSARIEAGLADGAVADLAVHVDEHPWREEGWALLARALYRAGRQGEALAAVRRARHRLADELGLDPGNRLQAVESDILRRAPHLDPGSRAERVRIDAVEQWERTAARNVRAGLEETSTLLRSLVLHGGSPASTALWHADAVAAAEELGDPALTARVLGSYEVPGSWARRDDPATAERVVAAAERALRGLGDHAARGTSVRLLTTIALGRRGVPGEWGPVAARRAEALARELGDPRLVAHALSGRFLQSFHRAGLAAERDALGAELLDLAADDDLTSYAVLGHLVRMQALGALGHLDAAARHARALDGLTDRHPTVGVFTALFDALHADLAGAPDPEGGYRRAAVGLHGAGMPGVEDGLLDLALVCRRLRRGEPAGAVADSGPYAPWLRPHRLLADGRREEAVAAVAALPDPAPDHVLEALWGLAGLAAAAVGDRVVRDRALAALEPARTELAGAGSGVLCLGPVDDLLARIAG